VYAERNRQTEEKQEETLTLIKPFLYSSNTNREGKKAGRGRRQEIQRVCVLKKTELICEPLKST